MEKNISFSKQVKEEISSNIYESKDRLRALLAAYIRINGVILIQNNKSLLVLSTESAKIAKFLYQTINDIYNADVHIIFLNKRNTKKKIYQIKIDSASINIVEDLEISFLEGKISKNIVKNDDTISGYLAGAFLASGSVNSPVTSNYHLEISLTNLNYAKWLSKLFSRYKNSNIEPKITNRREKFIIYFKKSDQIANFLIMIGAVNSCMDFENYRVDRDFTNSANRLTNIDTANIKKIYETSRKQLEDIEIIEKLLGAENIPNKKIRLLIKIRKENESFSLNEIAKEMSIQLNKKISKSSVNYLFKNINDIARRLRKHE